VAGEVESSGASSKDGFAQTVSKGDNKIASGVVERQIQVF